MGRNRNPQKDTFLTQYQQIFVKEVLNEDDECPALLEKIIPAGTLSPAAALKVYRQDYFARMTEAIGESYPAVWRVVGDEHFWTLCRQYIQQNPSTSYSLGHYGHLFPSFLEGNPLISEFPFLPELAAFEWNFVELFHQKQHEGMDPACFAQIENLEEKVFKFPPTVKVFQWKYAINDIWLLRDSEEIPENFDWNKRQNAVFFKRNHVIKFRVLDEVEVHLFSGLLQGKNLSDVMEELPSLFVHKDLNEEKIMGFFFFLVQSVPVVGVEGMDQKNHS